MRLERYRQFLEILDSVTKDIVALYQEAIASSERGLTEFSDELNLREHEELRRLRDLKTRMEELCSNYVERSFLENLLGLKPGIDSWPRARAAAKRAINQLPKEERSPAKKEYERLDVRYKEIEMRMLELPALSSKLQRAARASKIAAQRNTERLGDEIRAIDAELERRRKLKEGRS